MARPRNVVPTTRLRITLPQPLAKQLETMLYSELEGRVPDSAYRHFFADLVQASFDRQVNPCQHCSGTGVQRD